MGFENKIKMFTQALIAVYGILRLYYASSVLILYCDHYLIQTINHIPYQLQSISN